MNNLRASPAVPDKPRRSPPEGWWESAFTKLPTASEQTGHPCGHSEMLILVAYDITDHKRLAKVAKHCEDYGVRVQYSVFECRLASPLFTDFWLDLENLIDPSTDRIVAYRVCSSCAREILSAGTMQNTAKSVAYVF